jgi:hypothetical protein
MCMLEPIARMRVDRQLVDDILRRVGTPLKTTEIVRKYNAQRGSAVPIVNKRDVNSFLYSNKGDYLHDADVFAWQTRAVALPVADNAAQRHEASSLLNVAVSEEAVPAQDAAAADWTEAVVAAMEAGTIAGVPAALTCLHLDEGGASGSAADPVHESQCVVCMDERKSVLFIPCKHVCVCSVCAEQLGRFGNPVCCPVCRSVVTDRIAGVFC